MKLLVPALTLLFAGCQATPPPIAAVSPSVPQPAPETRPSAPADAALERKLRQQAQYIEALISQNEALSSRVNPVPESAPYPSPVARALAKPLAPAVAAPPPEPKPTEESALIPNADGVIDLAAALVAPKADESVNPFAVRTVPTEMMREVSLEVGGIVAGPVACAVINDRLVQPGDTIESLAVERIDPDAVILRHGTQRMRLPVGGKNLRVRLPI